MGPYFQIAQKLIGTTASYELTQALLTRVRKSVVFKAKVLSGHGNLAPESWVLIKTATSDSGSCVYNEYRNNLMPAISSSPFLRTMCDTIGDQDEDSYFYFDDTPENDPPCLVFEWMDQTLADISPTDQLQNDRLYKAIFEAGLGGLAALHKENLVHTDLRPDNILISNVNSQTPIVKVGDLGRTDSHPVRGWHVQPYAMRAPEVWQGHGCSHRSDVWSLAATLLVWMKPGILGIQGIKDGLLPSLWCTAKLMGLFPGWKGLPSATTSIRREMASASLLLDARDPDAPGERYLKVSPLEDELQAMGISREMCAMLRSFLVVDPAKRPDAAEALRSPEYLALARKVTERTSV